MTTTIKNSGNAIAPASTAFLTISDNVNFVNPIVLARATVKSLSANESIVLDFVYPLPTNLSNNGN